MRRAEDEPNPSSNRSTDPQQCLHAHILFVHGDGVPWAVIVELLYTSTATLKRWWRRYLEEGVGCIVGQRCWRTSVRHRWLADRSTLPIQSDA